MKKFFVLIVLSLCAAILLASCNDLSVGGPVSLDKSEIKTITNAIAQSDQNFGNYSIECYGKYEDVFICKIIGENGDSSEIKTDIIGGYTFALPENESIRVIGDGKIFSLYDAYYVKKIISGPELSAAHALFAPLVIETEPPIDLLNTPPTSTGPVKLSDDEMIAIVQAIIANDENASLRMAYYSIECYAKESGVYVGFIDEPGMMYLTALTSATVGNFTFEYSSGRQMRVFDGTKVYSMIDAYQQGILSDSLLEAAFTAYTNRK